LRVLQTLKKASAHMSTLLARQKMSPAYVEAILMKGAMIWSYNIPESNHL